MLPVYYRTSGAYGWNRTSLPGDIIAFAVFGPLRDRLTLRDPSEVSLLSINGRIQCMHGFRSDQATMHAAPCTTNSVMCGHPAEGPGRVQAKPPADLPDGTVIFSVVAIVKPSPPLHMTPDWTTLHALHSAPSEPTDPTLPISPLGQRHGS
jgi:hypothetical protein